MIEMMPLYCTLLAFSATAGFVAVQLVRKLRAETAKPQTRRAASL